MSAKYVVLRFECGDQADTLVADCKAEPGGCILTPSQENDVWGQVAAVWDEEELGVLGDLLEVEPVHWATEASDGMRTRVGGWRDGDWVPGNRADAYVELRALYNQGDRAVRVVVTHPPSEGWDA